MPVETADLVPILRELVSLSPAHQRVWIFCLVHLPVVRLYSSDVADVALRLGMTPRTVQRALAAIKRTPTLSRCVSTLRINPREDLVNESTSIWGDL